MAAHRRPFGMNFAARRSTMRAWRTDRLGFSNRRRTIVKSRCAKALRREETGHVGHFRGHAPHDGGHDRRCRIHEGQNGSHALRCRIHEARIGIHEPRGRTHAAQDRIRKGRCGTYGARNRSHAARCRIYRGQIGICDRPCTVSGWRNRTCAPLGGISGRKYTIVGRCRRLHATLVRTVATRRSIARRHRSSRQAEKNGQASLAARIMASHSRRERSLATSMTFGSSAAIVACHADDAISCGSAGFRPDGMEDRHPEPSRWFLKARGRHQRRRSP